MNIILAVPRKNGTKDNGVKLEAEKEADALIASRIAEVRQLSFAEIERLPASLKQDVKVANKSARMTNAVVQLNSGRLLLVVRIERRSLFRRRDFCVSRGVLFGRNGYVRDASHEEVVAALAD